MTIILGIDPGSCTTGYGVIRSEGSLQQCLAYGRIYTKHEIAADRLLEIHQGIMEIITTYQPSEFAIEQIFMHVNPPSALKLGQARGVALLAAAISALPIAEYSAKQIKQAVVGYGSASKDQVQKMIMSLLKIKEQPQADAADALAIALCHAHSRKYQQTLKRETI